MNVFVLNHQATLHQLAEQARSRAVQTHCLAETINSLSDDRESLQDRAKFVVITNLMWLLQDLLSQQETLCEQLESTTHEQGKAQEVQA